jgi:hypothetical protein
MTTSKIQDTLLLRGSVSEYGHKEEDYEKKNNPQI